MKYVFVVKPDNTVERRNLETAHFEGKRIVKSGLKDGEKVVSTRLQMLQPGMKVTPVTGAAVSCRERQDQRPLESQTEK